MMHGSGPGRLMCQTLEERLTSHCYGLVVVDRRLGEASFLQAGLALKDESNSLHPKYCCSVLRESFEVRNGDVLAFDSRHSPVLSFDSWDLYRHDWSRGTW